MFQKPAELRVSGRAGDAAMERKILRDRVLAALESGIDSIETVDDFANLWCGGTRRREAGGLDLDPGAQLHDVEYRA